MKTERGHQ